MSAIENTVLFIPSGWMILSRTNWARTFRLQLNRIAGARVHHIVVEKDLPRRFLSARDISVARIILSWSNRLVPDRVMPGDARPVRQHVAQGNRVVQIAVVELDVALIP